MCTLRWDGKVQRADLDPGAWNEPQRPDGPRVRDLCECVRVGQQQHLNKTKTFNDPVWQQKLLASVCCTVFQVDLNVYTGRAVDPIQIISIDARWGNENTLRTKAFKDVLWDFLKYLSFSFSPEIIYLIKHPAEILSCASNCEPPITPFHCLLWGWVISLNRIIKTSPAFLQPTNWLVSCNCAQIASGWSNRNVFSADSCVATTKFPYRR